MTVKVSPKYQVVIPESVRHGLHITPGMEMNIMAKGEIIYVIPTKNLKSLQESLRNKFSPDDLKKTREKQDRR